MMHPFYESVCERFLNVAISIRFWIWFIAVGTLDVCWGRDEYVVLIAVVLAAGLYVFPTEVFSRKWREHRRLTRRGTGRTVVDASVSLWKTAEYENEIQYSDGSALRWISIGWNEDWMDNLAARFRQG